MKALYNQKNHDHRERGIIVKKKNPLLNPMASQMKGGFLIMSKHTVSGIPIEVSASLRSYVSIQRQFSAKTDETIAAIDENARFYHSSLKQVSLITTYINMFIDDLIRSLSQDYNYYDCTRDDFILNDGYSQLMHIRQEFDSYCNQLKTSNNAQANLRLSIAAQEASSKITGLGFGIISNSLVAHLIYLAQNESTIRKQAAEAQTYFEEQEKQIRSQGEQRIESESRDYYNKVFMPRLRTVTRQIYRVCPKFCVNTEMRRK